MNKLNHIFFSLCLLFANSLSAQQDSLLYNQHFKKHLSFKDTFFGSEDLYQVCYPKDHRGFFYSIIIISIATLVLGIIIIYVKSSSNKKLKEKNLIIAEQHKDLVDSITYAQRLQQAILPPKHFIDTHLPDNFILYKPKDIVAGDFYWAYSPPSGELEGAFFIAAADSTGHGVPGAMVSVVCSNALNRAVKEFGLIETGKILDKTRELVLETFAKSNSEVKDGMDISLLRIQFPSPKERDGRVRLQWSGANNPLWYVTQSVAEALEATATSVSRTSTPATPQLHEIKPDKQPVGKTENPKPFTTHHIELSPFGGGGCTFYLFTDGFADQFGGRSGKKFMSKNLRESLIANSHLPMPEQKQLLETTFSNWLGNLEQVDDVTVIGIRV